MEKSVFFDKHGFLIINKDFNFKKKKKQFWIFSPKVVEVFQTSPKSLPRNELWIELKI